MGRPKKTPDQPKVERQVLGISVSPGLIVRIDELLQDYLSAQSRLPEWFKLPTSRAALMASLIERYLEEDSKALRAIYRHDESTRRFISDKISGINEDNHKLNDDELGAFFDATKKPFFAAMEKALEQDRNDDMHEICARKMQHIRSSEDTDSRTE